MMVSSTELELENIGARTHEGYYGMRAESARSVSVQYGEVDNYQAFWRMILNIIGSIENPKLRIIYLLTELRYKALLFYFTHT